MMCKKLVVLSLVVVFASSAIAAPAGYTPIHHWALEEGIGKNGQSANGGTAYDSIGTNHGTIYGLTWVEPGLNSTGSVLDQERDNWGEAVDIPTLHGEITGSFAVEAYIKAESWPESWQGSIFSNLNDDGVNRTGFQLRAGARNDQAGWDPNKGVLGFVIGSRHDTTNNPIWQTQESWQPGDPMSGPGLMDLGVEYHVMATYDAGTGEMAVWIGGVNLYSRTQMTTFQDSAQISEIGRDPMTTQRFDGLIDEVIVSIPEPATIALLGLGGLLLRKRRV